VQGAREVRSKAWLERALSLHQARAKMGKKPLMTLRHQFDNPMRVGEYELNGRLELAEVNPDEPPRWTLFGNKVYDDVQSFAAADKYLYRSPEISPDHPEELQALALLKDKEPMNPYPGLYEKLVRETTPELAEAFAGEAFAAQIAEHPQLWRGAPEVFEAASARSPYAVANAMLTKGLIDRAQYDNVVKAIQREGSESFAARPEGKKEGGVADQQDEKKAPSPEERMEAMASKFFEVMGKRFETLMSKYEGKGEKSDDDDDKGPGGEAAEAEPEEKKKEAETAQSRAPVNDGLPPAVSEMTPGEFFSAKTFAEAAARVAAGSAPAKNGTAPKATATAPAPGIPEIFSQRLAVQEQTILGLRGAVEKLNRERDAVGLVAEAKKALLDSGAASVSELFEAEVYKAAVKGGKATVDEFVRQVKIGMGLGASRGPETFQGLPGQATAPGLVTPEQESLKKALETFGNRPEAKRRVEAFYADYMGQPEHIRRSLGNSTFYDLCRGEPSINAGARQGEVIRG